MKAIVTVEQAQFNIDFNAPLDISIPLNGTQENPNAWYLDAPQILPVTMGDWVGSVASGTSSTNFNSIWFNPHAHGTHTECVGHITVPFYSINSCLKNFMFLAEVISVKPILIQNDWVITLEEIKKLKLHKNTRAIVIRTLPNNLDKLKKQYSHTNPPYFEPEVMSYFVALGIDHILVDLPSVDKEKDEGKLLCHKAFWCLDDVKEPEAKTRFNATITEFIYVNNSITDGLYVLNLQIASFLNDASPSKPILYKIDLEVDENASNFYVNIDRRLVKIQFSDVNFIEAKGDYILIKTITVNHTVHTTLKKIQKLLPKKTFLKIHRSFIINIDKIVDIEGNSVLISKDVIPISRSFRKELLDNINLL